MKFREAAIAEAVVRMDLGFRRFAQGFNALCFFGKLLPEGGIGNDGGGRIILQVQHCNVLVQVVQVPQDVIQPVGFFCFLTDGNMGEVDLEEVTVFAGQGRNVVPREMHVTALFRIGDGLVLSGAEDIEEEGVNVPAQGRGGGCSALSPNGGACWCRWKPGLGGIYGWQRGRSASLH